MATESNSGVAAVGNLARYHWPRSIVNSHLAPGQLANQPTIRVRVRLVPHSHHPHHAAKPPAHRLALAGHPVILDHPAAMPRYPDCWRLARFHLEANQPAHGALG